MTERKIRTTLLATLKMEHDRSDTLIIEELGVLEGSARVDVAVLNGSISGYEIKSDRDNFDRLPSQVAAYSECFDLLSLVVAPRHLSEASRAIPQWWGLAVARAEGEEVVLDWIRQPRVNELIRVESLVRMLWRDEAREILSARGGIKGLHKMTRFQLWQLILEAFDAGEIRSLVREQIKSRGDWRVEKRQAQSGGSTSRNANSRHSRVGFEIVS